MSSLPSKTSPLHQAHLDLGAKVGDFGGWSMPIEYSGGGVVAEHAAVRNNVGLFDVSHLGKAVVKGEGAVDFINSTLTNDIDRISSGQAQYTMCCNSDGGVIDDLIAYRVRDDEVFLIPNAANTSGVISALTAVAPPAITITGCHDDFAVLAVQGPQSPTVLGALSLPVDHDYMSFIDAELDGAWVRVCRTGYTGERGYELVVTSADAIGIWESLMSVIESMGGLACGLGARDTLRTEMGYALHGHELSPQITPVMARSTWAVGWSKPDFWGKEALVSARTAKSGRISRGLVVSGRGIPRAGCTVLNDKGEQVGEVTSGTFSPTLRQGIALALLDRDVDQDSELSVDVRGRAIPVKVSNTPFVQTRTR